MKGRRKVVSHKLLLHALYEAEAKSRLEARSKASANRFLDAALLFGKEFEPIGRLAGESRSPIERENLQASLRAHSAASLLRTQNLRTLLSQTIEVVTIAGQLLIAEWARIDGPRGKGDKAEVDVEIEQFLRQQLLRLLACDFSGQETGNCLTGHAWCWLVDPNDGTSDLLNGIKGSALSIGLLYEGTPVLGVVFAPVTNEGAPHCIAWAKGLRLTDCDRITPIKTCNTRLAPRRRTAVDENGRHFRFIHIMIMAEAIFGDGNKSRRWLLKPKSHFAGKCPMAMLTTSEGARQVEESLIQLAEGLTF